MNEDSVLKALTGIGCLYFTVIVAFWLTVVAVAVHFVAKFW